jgi:uncharacterized membrane protein (DUF4010 family)
MPAMELSSELSAVRDFAIALAIGALVGIEREKRKVAHGNVGIGGLRTFIFFAAIGAISAWLTRALDTPWLLVAATLSVSTGVVAGYVMHGRGRPDSLGLTTELAAIAVFLLGAMTLLGHQGLAVGLAIVSSAVLAFKQPLHGVVERLGWDDIFAGLRLLIASFIVLPLLPDRTVDPWHALNPYKLWLLVVLISGLSLLGYVATRWLGAHKGTALTGLTGGMVSSTAVTLSFARRSRDRDAGARIDPLACGILLAWGMMFARVVVEVLVVNPALLGAVLVPFSAMAAVAAAFAFSYYRSGPAGDEPEVALSNPFSLTSAIKFAALFAVVLVVVALVQRHFPGEGLYVVAALAGLTDVDAITLSMAQLAAQGGDAQTAVAAIVIASLSNTLVKAGLVVALAAPAMRWRMLSATGAILAAGLAGLLLR